MRPVSRRWLLKSLPVMLATDARRLRATPASAFQVRPVPLYCRQDGKLKRVLAANIEAPDYQSGSVELICGNRSARIQLRDARRSGRRLLLPVEAPDRDADFDCIYRDGARTLETQVRVLPERHWNIYLVHHGHHDIGYDDLPSKVRAEFPQELDDAVQYCRQTQGRPEEARFKWNIEISLLVEDYRRLRGEAALRDVVDLLKSGSLELAALSNNLQTELLTVEPLHRAVRYATSTLSKELGIQVQAAILNDVPGFAWGIADVFQSSGIRYFLFGGSPTRSNLFLEAMPILFYCEGPAGGRVLIFHSGRYSEGMIFTSRGRNKVELSEPDLMAAALLERYSDGTYPYDAVLLQTANDFIRPYREISDHVEQWNSAWEYPKLRMATVSEFFRYVEGKYAGQIPCLRGGCPDAWNDLRGSMAREVALARRLENELPDAEKWAALAMLAGDSDRSAALNRAYDNLLLFEEHTLAWHGGRDIYVDESEGGGRRHHLEKTAPLRQAAETADGTRSASLSYLSAKVRCGKSPRLLVWNPLSWNRTGIVRAPAPDSRDFVLRDAASGRSIPYQFVKSGPDQLEFVFAATDVPATGYRTYDIENGSKPPAIDEVRVEDGALENRYYRVRMNPLSGAVASVIDKETHQELADQTAPHGLNQLIYIPSREITHRRFEDLPEMRTTRIRLEKPAHGAVSASLKTSGAIESILSFDHEIVMYSGLKRLDFVTRLRKKPVYSKEGVYVAFPFSISGTQRFARFEIPVRIDVPGGFMRPDADQLGGSSRDYYVAQHGVRLDDGKKSLFWTSLDAPIVQFGGIQSNRWNTKLSEKGENFLAKPWLYSFVMNNHWYTNAPIAQGGEFTFRYSITSTGADAELFRHKQFGWETLSPMTAIWVTPGGGGAWADSGSFGAVEPDNVAIAAIKKADDGKGIIVRVIETAGLAGPVSLRLSIPGREVHQAERCDSNEHPGQPLPIAGGQIRSQVRPFETLSIRILLNGA